MKPRIDCDPKKSHYKEYDVIEGMEKDSSMILKSTWNGINNLFYFRNVFLIETSYLEEEEKILGLNLILTIRIYLENIMKTFFFFRKMCIIHKKNKNV